MVGTLNKFSTVSPWLTIWYQPTKTIGHIVATSPQQYVPLLAVLAGIAHASDQAVAANLGDQAPLSLIVIACVGVGAIAGLLSVYLGAALVGWVGRTFNHAAERVDLQAAIAWAALPLGVTTLLLMPELALFGETLFRSSDAVAGPSSLLAAFGLVEVVLTLWAFVLLVICLEAVSGMPTYLALILAILPTYIGSVTASTVAGLVYVMALLG
jgi:hypothetical protein